MKFKTVVLCLKLLACLIVQRSFGKVNLYENNRYIFHKNNAVCTKFAFAEARKYYQICAMHDLEQLIQCSTRVTFSALVDHILASFP